MATPKKKKTGADGKVPCPPDLREEAGFEPQAPGDNLARQTPKEQQEAYCNSVMRMVPASEMPVWNVPQTPEEVMRKEYPTLNGNIPELLKAILRELIIMRLAK